MILRPPSFTFFFKETATPEIYTLSLHDALPISAAEPVLPLSRRDPARGWPPRRGGRGGGTRRSIAPHGHQPHVHRAGAVGVQPAAAGRPPARRDLRSRDTEEAGELRCLRDLRAARHAARDSLPAGRRRTRDRHQPRGLFG